MASKRREIIAEERGRENNFNIVRLSAAIFVLAGHMGVLLGMNPPTFAGTGLHILGVEILFLIGGFLITKSWLSDPNPIRYAIKRFLRLWPPFAVMVILLTFVAGPMLSTLGWKGYFGSWYKGYLNNLRFFIVYAQPGVFENLPVPSASNGSIWTMPVEAALYVVTPILLTLLRVKNRSKASLIATIGLTVIMCAFDLYLRIFRENLIFSCYGTDLVAAYHLAVFYMIGIVFTYDEIQQHLNLQTASLALGVLLIIQYGSEALKQLGLFLALPFAVFTFALSPNPVFHRIGKKVELSYGIYLYGFFFQQMVIYIMIQQGYSWGYMICFVLSITFSTIAALLSYYIIEKPTQYLSKKLARNKRR